MTPPKRRNSNYRVVEGKDKFTHFTFKEVFIMKTTMVKTLVIACLNALQEQVRRGNKDYMLVQYLPAICAVVYNTYAIMQAQHKGSLVVDGISTSTKQYQLPEILADMASVRSVSFNTEAINYADPVWEPDVDLNAVEEAIHEVLTEYRRLLADKMVAREVDSIVHAVSGKSIYVTSDVDVPLMDADSTDVISRDEERAKREEKMDTQKLQAMFEFATHTYLPDDLTKIINRIGSSRQNLVVRDVERVDHVISDFKFLMPTDADQVYQMSGTGSLDGELAVILNVRFLESKYVARSNVWTDVHMEDYIKNKFAVSDSVGRTAPESNS
jgi:hypothetical protein